MNLSGESRVVVAVALASFNRRDITLRCLETLFAQANAQNNWTISVYLTDDASVDGTSAAIRNAFPDVHLLQGTGNLFWGGGMALAMTAALATRPDFLLMLNDDVELENDAISVALAEYQAACQMAKNPMQAIVGAVTDPVSGEMSYSGFKRTHRRNPSKLVRVPPDLNRLIACDTVNGNFVLLPRAITEKLGSVDATFVQQLGDIDYGYRIIRLGGGIWIARKPVGTCAVNHRSFAFRKPGLSLRAKWRAINHPLGLPLRPWAAFMWRWGGVYGMFVLLGIYGKAFINFWPWR